MFLNNLSLFFIFSNDEGRMWICYYLQITCKILLWMRGIHNLLFMPPTYYLPHLQMVPKFINASQHSCVKSYRKDIFREECLYKHMRLSLILPTLLWPKMHFYIFVCSTQTSLLKNACQALNAVCMIHQSYLLFLRIRYSTTAAGGTKKNQHSIIPGTVTVSSCPNILSSK